MIYFKNTNLKLAFINFITNISPEIISLIYFQTIKKGPGGEPWTCKLINQSHKVYK